jgi:hypothetical protein
MNSPFRIPPRVPAAPKPEDAIARLVAKADERAEAIVSRLNRKPNSRSRAARVEAWTRALQQA